MEAQQAFVGDGAQSCPTIGVFDSGVGGLTVARAILQQTPAARLLYLGDTAHVPYGPRPLLQVRDFALQIIDFLFQQGADAVVMGCNMSSAAGAREAAVPHYTKPIFEVIRPGCRAACAACQGTVGVIATQGTVTSGIYGRTLREFGPAVAAYEQACPAFVPLVERGLRRGPDVEAAVVAYLTPLRNAGIDTLIFGCTHYPLLRDAVADFLGTGVTLIDPAEQVACDVAAHFGPCRPASLDPARHRFFSSGDPESLRQAGEALLGFPLVHVERVKVPVEEPVHEGVVPDTV